MSDPAGAGSTGEHPEQRRPHPKPRRRPAVRILRIALPVVVVALILANVDLGRFGALVRQSSIPLVALGIAFMPTRVLAAALRWWLLLRTTFGRGVTYPYALRHYWSAVAVGFFTPASAGLEVYRLAVAGRRFGKLHLNVAIIMVEKLLALIGCAGLALALVPFLPDLAVGPARDVRQVAWAAAALLGLALIVLATSGVALRSRLANSTARQFQRLLRLAGAPGVQDTEGGDDTRDRLWNAVRPLARPQTLGLTLSTSLLIQVAGAIGGQIMFRAVGYDIPFVVNLFVVPILYIIFAVPISLGSIGVREGAFVLLYGMFGVPIEVALLVSLLNLAGLVFNSLVGATLMWARGEKQSVGATWRQIRTKDRPQP